LAFSSNKIFFFGALIFVSISAILVTQNYHGDAIKWFASHRSDLLNLFFTSVTRVGEEWSYILLLIILLFYRFRYALMVFVLAILVPAISMSLKKFFSCPRPKKYFMDHDLFESLNLIEGVVLYTGNSSFPSGHTISAFAVMGFASFVFAKYKWSSSILIGLSICVAISRVYMVQHFLLDVAVGAIIGCGIALFTSWLSIKIKRPNALWLEKNLRTVRKRAPRV